MKSRTWFACFITFVFLTSTAMGRDRNIELSLDKCIATALRNNLNLAVEILNPELSEISISQAKEKFLPQLSFTYGNQHTKTPSYSWIEAAEEVTADYQEYQAQLSQQIPTGGKFSISLYSYKSDSNQKFQTINPRYGSSLSFNFSQPLLKNFGFTTSRKEIIVARNNLDMSEAKFKGILLDTVYSVEKAYWDLAYSAAHLDVMKQSLKLARDLLAKNKREVEVGTLAPIEILTAEAEVATREADILQAEVAVKNHEDSLKTVINLGKENTNIEAKVVITDKPTYEEYAISIEEALRKGLENRPDLQELRLDIKNKDIEAGYAKNQLLPELTLNASYWSPGLSGSQILYQNNDPLSGVIIGLIPGNASNALRDAIGFKYNNWYIGLTLTIPTNTIFSRAQYAQARVNMEKKQLELQYKEQQAFLEIRNAVRTVQTNFKRINAYKIARELAEKKLEAEEKKLKVGLTTNYIVLQQQRDLATARSNELRAITDYILSQAALDKAMGTTFISKNIKAGLISP
ncbi:MAG: TolC family protein [Candidatus Aminicenantes bacterium]|nr:TolC family protein [Candidatus Aminicenantes bacterium]